MKKPFLKKLPYFYFPVIILWVFAYNLWNGKTEPGTFLLLFFALPFVAQLFLKSRLMDAVLGFLSFLWSGWMFLAWLSDVADIIVFDAKAWQFILLGGLMTAANIVMACLILNNFSKKATDLYTA